MTLTVNNKPYIVPPCQQAVEILYQDEHLLLLNKPSGLLSVPGKHPANRDCLISRIQQDYKHARIVHRLDMDTSGIMVVALTATCHRQLNQLFAERKVSKQYLAEVYGLIDKDNDRIDMPLICDWPNRPRQMVDRENGKQASTQYRVLSRDPGRFSSQIVLTPTTGRSHQLRVHMAEIGHPILGCAFYAHPQALAMAPRLLLHASQLIFKHPVTGQQLTGDSHCPF